MFLEVVLVKLCKKSKNVSRSVLNVVLHVYVEPMYKKKKIEANPYYPGEGTQLFFR